MEQVIISTALVMAIWCGGKLLVLARRDQVTGLSGLHKKL